MVEKLVIPKHAIEIEGGYFWLENNIVHIYNKPTDNLRLEVALLNIELSSRVTAGVSRPILIDMTYIKLMERAAREAYVATVTTNYVTAATLITRIGISRIMGNFFIGFNRAEVPTRMFNDYTTPLSWLKKFLLSSNAKVFRHF